jgi:hypothetical protein
MLVRCAPQASPAVAGGRFAAEVAATAWTREAPWGRK